MAGIVRNTKKVDNNNRVALPREWCTVGDVVYFEITKSGNLILHKMKNKETDKEVPITEENS